MLNNICVFVNENLSMHYTYNIKNMSQLKCNNAVQDFKDKFLLDLPWIWSAINQINLPIPMLNEFYKILENSRSYWLLYFIPWKNLKIFRLPRWPYYWTSSINIKFVFLIIEKRKRKYNICFVFLSVFLQSWIHTLIEKQNYININ